MRPLIPLAIPNVGAAEARNLQKCIDDNWVSTVGPFVVELERRCAELSGVEGGASVAAGTMGLHIALVALGVTHGDLVIAPSYTFIATSNAIAHAGATPWFVDIDENSWSMSPAALAQALEMGTQRDAAGVLRHKGTGRRVAAVLPVYALGTPADMDGIVPVARAYGLPVLADAAAAIGVTYRGQPIGPLADLTSYSFNGNKTITCGGGGMVVGPDPALVGKVKHLVTTARVGTDYDHDVVGYNYRMTNLQAAVGCAQLDRVQDFIEAKRRIRRTYDAAFAGHPALDLFPDPTYCESTYWFSGVVLKPDCGLSQQEVVLRLNERSIQGRAFWKPNHMLTPHAHAPREALPVTESFWDRVITLPCSTQLSTEDQDYVIETLLDLVNSGRKAA